MTEVRTTGLRGEPDELADAAEDLQTLLDAAAAGRLDLSPVVETWFAEVLECVEEALAEAEVAA